MTFLTIRMLPLHFQRRSMDSMPIDFVRKYPLSNIRYYSQNGEDLILSKFFHGKKKGFYIEVGAFDGVHLSNTYFFEKLGWDGICIEAHPLYFPQCKENRANSLCIHAACTGDEALKEVTFSSEELGLLSGIEERGDIKQRYDGRGLKFEGFKKVTVPAVTLNSVLGLLKEKPEIDFVSIDVEGHELEVLKGLNLEIYRPRILVIEANTSADETKLDNFLVGQRKYFKAKRLSENVFYCRESSDAQKLITINIKSYVSTSPHPLGEKYDLPSRNSNSGGFFMRVLNKVRGL